MKWRIALGLALGLAVAAPAGGQAPVDPCHFYRSALCPDLIMAPPSGLFVGRSPRGRLRLYATNHIINVGAGPLDIKGKRTGAREMRARQVIHRGGLRPIVTPDAGELYFKFVDRGRGSYWKYSHAARFELWSLDADGNRVALVRTGPKLDYCFRDLSRVRAYARRTRRYPGCSQARGLATDRLGVSPGWADVYPSTYPENWIDITGLKGCFSFIHRADPLGKIAEEREDNNIGFRHIRLPPRHGSVAPRGCP
jgi:Lysyl oxidase